MLKNKIKESEDSVRIVNKLRTQAEYDIAIMVYVSIFTFQMPSIIVTLLDLIPAYNYRDSSDELQEELNVEQDIDDGLMRNIGFLNNNMMVLRNQHKALMEKRNTVFKSLKVRISGY